MIGSTELPFFYEKDKTLYLFDNLHTARTYLSTKDNSWYTSKAKKKILNNLEDKGQFSFCSFPTKNKSFLKRASLIDVPLWKFIDKIHLLETNWNEGKYEGQLTFETSAYEKTKTANFLPIYNFSDEEEKFHLYLKPHQLTPNLIRYKDNKLSVLDYLGKHTKRTRIRG